MLNPLDQKLNVYIFGTKIFPLKQLFNPKIYEKIISSRFKEYKFSLKCEFDKSIIFNYKYFGRDEIGDNYRYINSSNHGAILSFLNYDKSLNLLKKYVDKEFQVMIILFSYYIQINSINKI